LPQVTHIWNDRRFGSYELKVKDNEQLALPDVELFEYTEAAPDEPWAKWVYDTTTGHEIEAVLER
jgi:hypothetical protein